MKKVLILKGIPGSGKSTFARNLIDNNISKDGVNNWKRINKDELRAMLDNSHHAKPNEKFVLGVRNNILAQALVHGSNVIIDDTNLNPEHEKTIREIVDVFNSSAKTSQHGQNYVIEVRTFDVDLQTAIKRDLQRPTSVGESVVRRMYKEMHPESEAPAVEPYVAPAGVPKAIISDIDGTLAHMTKEGRLRFGRQAPYMWHNVGEDIIDVRVANIVREYYALGYEVILFSGRCDEGRPETEQWLADNDIPYHQLHMRPHAQENEKDFKIKEQLFDQYVRDKYDVLFILDDRDQVVKKWRDLGLLCLQVAYGGF